MEWALANLAAEQSERAAALAYLEGDQRTILPAERIPVRFLELFRTYRKNICRRVVGNLSDRLRLDGWESSDEQLRGAADDVWQRVRGDTVHAEVHDDALAAGVAYVLAWPDPDTGRAQWWTHRPTNVTVRYGDRDELDAAAKVWVDSDGAWRLTTYYPDRLERWRAEQRGGERGLPAAEAWQPHDRPDDDEPHEEPNPYGVVPWAAFPHGRRATRGRSILTDVIPLQDQLNALSLAMLYAMASHALPPRWVIGAEPTIDPDTGRKIPPFHSDDAIWGLPASRDGETKAFGQFDPGDLNQIQQLRSATMDDVAEVTGQPAWTLRMPTGEWPSGEALRTALGPIVKQVEHLQALWSAPWRDLMRLSLIIDGAASGDLEDVDVEPQWAPVVEEPPSEQWQRVAQLVDLGFPLGAALRHGAGWTQDAVDELLAEQADEEQTIGRALREAALNGGDPASLTG